MSYRDVQPPDLFPILSPGKHRNPRSGACFMELASLLAGERWSDHPPAPTRCWPHSPARSTTTPLTPAANDWPS
jgi:hypothetical protein